MVVDSPELSGLGTAEEEVDRWISQKLEGAPVPHFTDPEEESSSKYHKGQVMDVTSFLSRTDRSEARDRGQQVRSRQLYESQARDD